MSRLWRHLRSVAGVLAPLSLGSVAAADGGKNSSSALPFATTFQHGGLTERATGAHYTTSLDLASPLLLRGSADFMAAARADARDRLGLAWEAAQPSAAQAAALEQSVREHLAAASSRRSKFLLSGAVHDREEIGSALESMFRQHGQLGLLLGGKSVGKSLLLAALARRTDIVGANGATRALLYIDAREFSTDLSAGLQAALLGGGKELERPGWWARLGLAGPSQRHVQASKPDKGEYPNTIITSASMSAKLRGIALETQRNSADKQDNLSAMQRNVMMLSKVVELAQAQGLYVCLVVDEANLALPMPPSDPHDRALSASEMERFKDTRLLLEKLVLLTKQSNRMNALIVTSEYSFPYRLEHGGFFNSSNFTATFFSGEVPPPAMRALLQDEWGLGPRLSDVFLAFYGGHVHMAAQALAKLATQLDEFHCEGVAPGLASHHISTCLRSREAAPMAAMLRALAERGFAPVQSAADDACAQTLSRANLGGLVRTSATLVGLPEELRRSAEFGVVPASHFMVRAEAARPLRSFVWALPLILSFALTSSHFFCVTLSSNLATRLSQRHLFAKALFKARRD